MRRPMLVSAAMAAALLVIATGAVVSGRDTDRASAHALIGAWVVDPDTATDQDPPALLTIASDGTLRLSDCCGAPAAGVWGPSSTRTADVTLLVPWSDEDGFIGFNVVRADVVVSADGDSLTATYTNDVPAREGDSTGELGPLTAVGQRIQLEPMGEPVGGFPPQPPETASPSSASPEASPGV